MEDLIRIHEFPWWLDRDPRPIETRVHRDEDVGARIADDAYGEVQRWCEVTGDASELVLRRVMSRLREVQNRAQL